MLLDKTTLGEISIDNKGYYGIAASAVDYSKELYTYLRITDITDDGRINYTNLKSVNDINAKNYLLKPNDIVFARTGGSTGRNYFYDGNEGEFVYAGFLIKFSLDDKKVNPRFIKYYCQSSKYKNWILSYNTGSTRGNINAQTYANMEIELPPRDYQDRAVLLLDSIENKLLVNTTINNNLEQQAMALFKSWFIDYEPFNGSMPVNWSEDILGKFIEIKRGGSPRPIQDYISDSGYRWLKISDATSIQSPFILNIKEHIKESGINKTVFLKAGSLVLSNSATPGIPKILDVDSCIHDGWLYFPESKLSNEYLYLLFKFIRPNLVALGNGSVFTNLKTDILRNYNTILPDKETLKRFDNIAGAIFEKILYNTRENEKLIQLRDTLLPKLMSGEIDVSNVDISTDKLLFSEDKS